ncbi:MAG: hypothetical protein EH225_11820 [Calditrichaeota bacterium]|nr:lysophospholipid acyltransferase family protein [Calditrichota bacterium]RQV99289.1 MAG: hypothetical protein EH225_11820 [Calditrichota bacterium]
MKRDISAQYRLEGFGYHIVEKLVGSLPDNTLPQVARFFAFLAFTVLRIRRRVSLENLNIAFPEKSLSWKKQIAYYSYLHFSLVILEFMKMNSWNANQLERHVYRASVGNVMDALRHGEGAIVVSGHFGNWEIGIGHYFFLGVASTVIQQRQKNPLINDKMKALREKWGMEIVYPRGAVRNCAKALKRGRLVAILGDQDAGDKGVFVPFFGRLSSTHIGAAVLQIKTGVRIFLGRVVRINTGKFDIDMIEIPNPERHKLKQHNVRSLTAELMSVLEREIRKKPAQYFWMHRRWKTPPPQEK